MLGLSAMSLRLPLNCLPQGYRNIKWGRNWNRDEAGVRNYKVTVVGAGGGIGQPLSLLLKQNPLIKELSLYDICSTKGVAEDLSHICTAAQVEPFGGSQQKELLDSLYGSNVVVVPAGMPRKPGMTRDQLLSANANVAMDVAHAVSVACPKALLAIITNPLNTIVPIVAEFLKLKGHYDPNRLFGVTTLDVVRAKTFIADHMNINPTMVDIPVIGGHAGITIMPLFSQCLPQFQGNQGEVDLLTHRIQEAGTQVVQAKAGQGSATLSMAYAAAHFVNALLRGLQDEPNVVEFAYVASDVTELPFFATPLQLGPTGIKRNLGIPNLSEGEREALDKMLPLLKQNIDAGLSLAAETLKRLEEAQAKEKVAKAAKGSKRAQKV